MQLVLERRAERSTVIAIASPLIAIGLTLTTMAVLFAALGKNPVAALMIYFIAPLTDSYSLIELAVKATPLAMIAVGRRRDSRRDVHVGLVRRAHHWACR